MEDYAQSEGLNGESLAARLGVHGEDLGRLGLCRRPAGETFTRDVQVIAQRFGIDETLLAEVVRRSDALTALRKGDQSVAALAAARDREHSGGPPDIAAHGEAPQQDEDST